MSADDYAERCPRCKWRGLDKVHHRGQWFTRCDGCGYRDEGFDQAADAVRNARREERHKEAAK